MVRSVRDTFGSHVLLFVFLSLCCTEAAAVDADEEEVVVVAAVVEAA